MRKYLRQALKIVNMPQCIGTSGGGLQHCQFVLFSILAFGGRASQLCAFFFHFTCHKHTGTGINGDVQHKLMSLYVLAVQRLSTNQHIHLYVSFLFVCLLFHCLRGGKYIRDAKRTEINACRRRTKCLVLTTGFICLLMICGVERGAGATASCSQTPLTWSLFTL